MRHASVYKIIAEMRGAFRLPLGRKEERDSPPSRFHAPRRQQCGARATVPAWVGATYC
jgi:hypothetical protein